jgi:hypothetical protein
MPNVTEELILQNKKINGSVTGPRGWGWANKRASVSPCKLLPRCTEAAQTYELLENGQELRPKHVLAIMNRNIMQHFVLNIIYYSHII